MATNQGGIDRLVLMIFCIELFKIVVYITEARRLINRNISKRCMYVKEENFTSEQILPIL